MPQLRIIVVFIATFGFLANTDASTAQTVEYSHSVDRYLVDLGSYIRRNYDKGFTFKGVVPKQSGANNPVVLQLTGKIVSQSRLSQKSYQFQFMKKLSNMKGARVVHVPKVQVDKGGSVQIYSIPIPSNAVKIFGKLNFKRDISTIIIPVLDKVARQIFAEECTEKIPVTDGDWGELCYCTAAEKCEPQTCNDDCPLDNKGFTQLSSQMDVRVGKNKTITLEQVQLGDSILRAHLEN